MDSDKEKKRREIITEESVKGIDFNFPSLFSSTANGEAVRKLFNPSELVCKNGAIFYIKNLEKECGK